MATQVITEPMFLDSTANNMIDAINGLSEAVQPTNIYLDMEISIPVNGWSATAPYTYTWSNKRVTTECGVEVHFKDGAENIEMSYLGYEKVIGGILFTIDKVPNAAIPLVVRIINAEADTIISATTADLIVTDAVPGTANVQEALENHEARMVANESSLSDVWDEVDELDTEIAKRVQSVNGVLPNESGSILIDEIPFARQLVTDDAQQSSGEFLFRTTGGDASLTDGPAKLVAIYGRSLHTGEVQEELNLTVSMVQRLPEQENITATVDRDTFVSEVSESGTTVFTFEDAWDKNLSEYGITVTGEPLNGDVITVVYVKADRGLITNSNPSAFVSTGWNLYNHDLGYAKVKRYSENYGYLIGGTFSGIEFSETLDGSKQTISPVSGYFTIPADGYIWVYNGNNTDTYILMTWSDWGEGYPGDWEAYSETTVDLSDIMTNFPNGLMHVGNISDEINFSMKRAISKIERLAYTQENIDTIIASGRVYDADEEYIYAVRTEEIFYDITETGVYTASDHGNEIIEGGDVPVYLQTLYGQNLVDKLRTDVLTKSADLVNNLTTSTAGKALDASQGKVLADQIAPILTGKGLWNGNIDNYKTTGVGWIQKVSSSGTQPSFDYYSLIVTETGYSGIVTQTAVQMGTGYASTRLFANNAWSPWYTPYDQIVSQTLSSATDFNTLTATSRIVKRYDGVNIRIHSNIPTFGIDMPFTLEVMQIGNATTYTKQILYMYGGKTYTRTQVYVSGSVQWGDWSSLDDQIATSSNVVAATGATYIRFGRMVIAAINVDITNTAAWADTQLTGLPTPSTNTPVTLRSNSDGAVKVFFVSNETPYFTLNNSSTTAQSANYRGQFAYIAKVGS